MTATASARTNRRRRLLQDGTASTPSNDSAQDPADPGVKVRYTPREGSASFAFAASVLPRSVGALLATGAALIAVVVALGWVDGLTTSLTGGAFADVLTLGAAGSLSAWWESALWLGVAGQAAILFGLRRQRTDDVSGGYRWWLVVAAAASLMSLQSATQVHSPIAVELARASGFSPLPGATFWWLVPGVLVLAAIATRTLLETRESVAATTAGALAVTAAALGWLVSGLLIPLSAASWITWIEPTAIGPLASMATASLTLLTLLLYSRRIVLEVEGAVAPPAERRRPEASAAVDAAPLSVADPAPVEPVAETKPKPAPRKPRLARTPADETPVVAASEPDEEEPAPRERRSRRAAKQAEPPVETQAETQWVSGGESYDDDAYDDDGAPKRRKLSKAERKRLRREKARRAA